jgi:hypothetical protein
MPFVLLLLLLLLLKLCVCVSVQTGQNRGEKEEKNFRPSVKSENNKNFPIIFLFRCPKHVGQFNDALTSIKPIRIHNFVRLYKAQYVINKYTHIQHTCM